jgi:DNA replication ATP-dependent helicase Dna2
MGGGYILATYPKGNQVVRGKVSGMPDYYSREELIAFVQRETTAEEREILEKHLPRVSTRVQNGDCITDVQFINQRKDGSLVYRYQNNLSKFRAGDLLLVNNGKPSGIKVSQNGTLVWLREIDFETKMIVVEKQNETDAPKGQSCTIDKGYFDYNSQRLMHSLEVAFGKRKDIAELLLGKSMLQPVKRLDVELIARHRSQQPKFTKLQCQATAMAASSPVTLIQGPPGTGKTRVLAQIVCTAIAQGKNVLITAYTHRAIDNLLEKIAEMDGNARIFKVMGKSPSPYLPDSITQLQFDAEQLRELGSPHVLGATVYQSCKMHMCDFPMFDLVVIDEAGQMPITHATAALIMGEKFVIAGDHKQLAPVFQAKHPQHLSKSFFELLQEHYVDSTITLDTTFRMNHGINKFPNEAFYDGRLKPSSEAAARRFRAVDVQCLSRSAIGLNKAVTFIKLTHQDAVQVSREEALVVAQLTRDLLIHQQISPKELAIVSPHRAQNREIQTALMTLLANEDDLRASVKKNLLVDTVERLQGQEREVIIFSLCASNPSYLQNRADFLFNPNRLNVALTRSRTKLFIVGSENFFPRFSGVKLDKKIIEIFDDYHAYLESRSVNWE